VNEVAVVLVRFLVIFRALGSLGATAVVVLHGKN
jgi:hypothetical protein